jgi:hypothetical protein
MKTYLILAFLLFSGVVFSQASMTDETFDELQQYAEKLSDGENVDIPGKVKIEKTKHRYSTEGFSCQFDHIVDDQSKKTIGLFITCIQKRSQYDEYQYLILPFNNSDKLDVYMKKKKGLVYSMEEFVDKATSYMLTKFSGQLNNN